jgi:hypothetical protein
MGGSNPNTEIAATHFDPNQGIGSGMNTATINNPWAVSNAHPEAITQGIGSGFGDIAKGLSSGYKSKQDEDQRIKERQEDLDLKKQQLASKGGQE